MTSQDETKSCRSAVPHTCPPHTRVTGTGNTGLLCGSVLDPLIRPILLREATGADLSGLTRGTGEKTG